MCFSLGLSACEKSDAARDDSHPIDYPETPHGKVTIAHLKSMCRAESQRITDDISIEGHIIVNDLYGEYTYSIIVGDSSGCIEISVDTDSTAEIFAVGARIVVRCSSLALGDYGGKVILGALPTGEYNIERIKEVDFARYFLIDETQVKTIEPQERKIDTISTADIGNYIILRDVQFSLGGTATWCDIEAESGEYITTERQIIDSEGQTFNVRTIAQCLYRDEILPDTKVALCGIVEYFNGDYSLRVINHQVICD